MVPKAEEFSSPYPHQVVVLTRPPARQSCLGLSRFMGRGPYVPQSVPFVSVVTVVKIGDREFLQCENGNLEKEAIVSSILSRYDVFNDDFGMVVDSSEPSTVYDNVEIRMVKERKYEVFSSSSSNNMQQTCPSNNKTILAGVHSLTRDHSSSKVPSVNIAGTLL
uniref:Uncharacterized protein n=1 Tax=Oryza sativa subsp. japonica TaxID=39947 RepID=Q6ZJG1_ORYSJ|nr:hypothetical protein [Oryza sativa Japonica Group]